MAVRIKKNPIFKNRQEAAKFLCPKLYAYKGKNPLVLAIPRGAVPMGKIIAAELGGELDVVLVHKLGAPGNPEYAMGAVSERGALTTAAYAQHLAVTPGYLQEEVRHQTRLLEHRRKLYTPHREPLSATNRLVILVDDGIATGSTLQAAIREVDSQKPAQVVVAAAVAPPEAVEILKAEADEVVVLAVRPDFKAIGDFFQDFTQVTDEEVVEILKKSRSTD